MEPGTGAGLSSLLLLHDNAVIHKIANKNIFSVFMIFNSKIIEQVYVLNKNGFKKIDEY